MAKKKSKKNVWFTKVRGSYLPASVNGWLTYIPFAGYLVATAILTWRIDAADSTRIYLIVVQWAFAGLFMTLLAMTKS